jgi:hypothetical protein
VIAMSKSNDGGQAFPSEFYETEHGDQVRTFAGCPGMSLRDYFAARALANPSLCSGTAHEYELRAWFGGRSGITKQEIVAAQAYLFADAMLAAGSK